MRKTLIIILTVLLSINTHFLFSQNKEKTDALLIGKMSIRFNNYKGYTDTLISGLSAIFSQHASYKDAEIIDEFTVSADSSGYFSCKLSKPNQFLKVLKIENKTGLTINSNNAILTVQKTIIKEKLDILIYFVVVEFVINKNGKVAIPMQFCTKKEFSIAIIEHAIKNPLLINSWHKRLIESKKIVMNYSKP